MPFLSYCGKCKQEVPLGEICPLCGKNLPKTGERFVYNYQRIPWKDWFEWNRFLRILLPMWAGILLVMMLSEYAAGGQVGLVLLLQDGLLPHAILLLGGILLIYALLLFFHQPEQVHVVIDKSGVTVSAYLGKARSITQRIGLIRLQESPAKTDPEWSKNGFTYVRRTTLTWDRIRSIHFWRGGATMLFYQMPWWLSAAVPYAPSDFQTLQELLQQKAGRKKINLSME